MRYYAPFFKIVFAFIGIAINSNAQLPKLHGGKLERVYPIDLQRHLVTTLKYPDKSEKAYLQGNTVAYFRSTNKKIKLIAIAPKLADDIKKEIIKAFSTYKGDDLADGFYGLPLRFRIHNVVTTIKNEDLEVHQNYIELPFVEIYTGEASYCNPQAPHKYCENGTLHSWITMQNPPEYPGGYKSFIEFTKSQIVYPNTALKNQVQGNVFVSFIIDKDGILKEPKIQRTLGYGTDEEAIRVLRLSKKWKPGMENGKPVRTIYHLPIKFEPKKPFNKPKPAKIYKAKELNISPQYPGGEGKLNEFIQENINYDGLTNKKVKGTLVLRAIVEMDGSLKEIKALDDLGYGTKKEALRIVHKLKRWNPGIKNGIPARTTVIIPVKFGH